MVNMEIVRAGINLLSWAVDLAKQLQPMNKTEWIEIVRPLVNQSLELVKIGIQSLIAALFI